MEGESRFGILFLMELCLWPERHMTQFCDFDAKQSTAIRRVPTAGTTTGRYGVYVRVKRRHMFSVGVGLITQLHV